MTTLADLARDAAAALPKPPKLRELSPSQQAAVERMLRWWKPGQVRQ